MIFALGKLLKAFRDNFLGDSRGYGWRSCLGTSIRPRLLDAGGRRDRRQVCAGEEGDRSSAKSLEQDPLAEEYSITSLDTRPSLYRHML